MKSSGMFISTLFTREINEKKNGFLTKKEEENPIFGTLFFNL